MTPVGSLRAIRRRWWLPAVLVVVGIFSVLVIGSSSRQAQLQYTAKAILLVNPNANQANPPNLQEAALEATVGSVPATAAHALGYVGNPTNLASEVSATADSSVGTLTVQVSGADGPRDAKVADAFADALNHDLTQTAVNAYESQVASVEAHLNSLQQQVNQDEASTDPISQAKLGAAEDQYRLVYDQFQQLAGQGQPAQVFVVLQKAVPVQQGGVHTPSSKKVRVAITALVALLIGIGLAIGLDVLFPRINDREDAEREFGTVVLAEVPNVPRRERQSGLVQSFDRSDWESFHEAHRMLRSAIFLFSNPDGSEAAENESHGRVVGGKPDGAPQIILVTSPLPGEGKSTTVANLALAMAESGRRALVCNLDFRAPTIKKLFGVRTEAGLTDLITESNGSNLTDIVNPTGFDRVSLVHSGKDVRDAAHLVASRGRVLLEEARGLADVVLLDTAPLLVVSDASELLPVADAVIMVARAGKTSCDSARRAYDLLDRAAIPVLGVVLVGGRGPAANYYAGHYGRRFALELPWKWPSSWPRKWPSSWPRKWPSNWPWSRLQHRPWRLGPARADRPDRDVKNRFGVAETAPLQEEATEDLTAAEPDIFSPSVKAVGEDRDDIAAKVHPLSPSHSAVTEEDGSVAEDIGPALEDIGPAVEDIGQAAEDDGAETPREVLNPVPANGTGRDEQASAWWMSGAPNRRGASPYQR